MKSDRTSALDSLEDLDKQVLLTIQYLFPGGTNPDQDNFTAEGRQHKAPDHNLLNGQILIERKSLNQKDDGKFYSKLQQIARAQSSPIRAYGKFNLAHVVRGLPNPDDANRILTDYSLSQLDRHVGNARKQFAEHSIHKNTAPCTRILIVSDNSTILSATDSVEYYLGRKFIRNRKEDSQTGLIDCIIYIKRPPYVMDLENSFWFKCLINADSGQSKQRTAETFSAAIFEHLEINFPLEWKRKFRWGWYRSVLA